MSETEERTPLAQRISTLDQVTAMSLSELATAEAQHQAEITELTGRIEARADDFEWVRRARQALRLLKLHLSWISREHVQRRRSEAQSALVASAEAARQQKAANREHAAQALREAAQAKMDRIKASNDKTAQEIAVFKEVSREVLGAEMYEHLWELARSRMKAA